MPNGPPRSQGFVTTLSARVDRFDSLPADYAPDDFNAGFRRWGPFLGANFLPLMPPAKDAAILCVSCGVGFSVKRLNDAGYTNVLGIDSNPDLVANANRNRLNCITVEALPFLAEHPNQFDVIWCANEIMHLTKDELFNFLELARRSLRTGGHIIVISHNAANPITATDGLGDNIDHCAIYTPHAMKQILVLAGFHDPTVLPLKMYVFYANPLNYIGLLAEALISLTFKAIFFLYNKRGSIFTKKIIGVGRKLETTGPGPTSLSGQRPSP